MAKILVGFWNCMDHAKWHERTITERLTKMCAAAFALGLEARLQGIPSTNAIQAIFVAQEYAFAKATTADEYKAMKKPAMHTDAAGYAEFKKVLLATATGRPTILMVPGTIAHAANDSMAENSCIAVMGANTHAEFSKRENVGELQIAKGDVLGDGYTFKPGAGYGTFTIDTNVFAVQICKDALTAPPIPTYDVHIVVAQGLGEKEIVKPVKLRIVANATTCDVVQQSGNTKKTIAPYRTEVVLEIPLVYFKAEY